MSRAARRANAARAKSRAVRRIAGWYAPTSTLYPSVGADSERMRRIVGKAARTPCPCSDPECCGNRRHSSWGGPPRDEVRALTPDEAQRQEAT